MASVSTSWSVEGEGRILVEVFSKWAEMENIEGVLFFCIHLF
jgi:hypothetical protein